MIRKTGSGEARRKFIRMSSLEPQPRTEYRVSRKELLWIVGSAGITLLALALLANSTSLFKRSNREEAAAWSQKPISAGYIGSQLKQIDKTRSEERRVGKEWRTGWRPDNKRKGGEEDR